MKRLILSVIAIFSIAGNATAKKDCEGIFPKNDRWIGIGIVDQGITEQAFNGVLDKIVAIYNPIAKAHGYGLIFNRLWTDGTVNSDTTTSGGNWEINSYGGLARYSGITTDAYAAVACHELGHHLGGAPLFRDGSEMSVEGEADYHVGTKCMRKYFAGDDNVRVMSGVAIDPMVAAKCASAFPGNDQEIAICERTSMASLILANVLRELSGTPKIAFNTPDLNQVSRTYEDHPEAQCRLDTYFESALCTVSSDVEFSNSDAKTGACVTGDGARSRCWFKP